MTTIPTSSSIFLNTYRDSRTGLTTPSSTWHPYLTDDFHSQVLVPTIFGTDYIPPFRFAVSMTRTTLYLATRVCELVAHTLVAMNRLFQHLNQRIQGVSNTSLVHSVVINAASDSSNHNETFFSHAGIHLARKARKDYNTCKQLFKGQNTFQSTIAQLLAKVVDWTFIMPQMLLMQGASTACEAAGILLKIEEHIKPDIASAQANLTAYLKRQQTSHLSSQRNLGTRPYPHTQNNPWFGWWPFNSPILQTKATPIEQLPTFNRDTLALEPTTIQYDNIRNSETKLRAWMQNARNFILANQEKMQPVGLTWHNNLCFYNTYFQVVIHNVLMQGDFLKDDQTSQAIWDSIFRRKDLDTFRDDMVRYLHALVKGIEKKQAQQTCLDGQLPNIEFGKQDDVLAAITCLTEAYSASVVRREKTEKADPKSQPLAACIQPREAGNYIAKYIQLPFESWFSCDRKTLFIKPPGFNLLHTWLTTTQVEASDIIISYNSKRTNSTTELSVRNGNLDTLLDLIKKDKDARSYGGSDSITFTLKNIKAPERLATIEVKEPRIFTDMETAILDTHQPTFTESVQLALTGSYTNPTGLIWQQEGAEQKIKTQSPKNLEDLRLFFMVREQLTPKNCFEDSWERIYPNRLLMRVKYEMGPHLLKPEDRVKPELRFELDSIKWNLTAFSYHWGTFQGGHWVAYRKNPNGQWYCFNDSQVSPVTEEDVQNLIQKQQLDTQVANVIYQQDITEATVNGDLGKGGDGVDIDNGTTYLRSIYDGFFGDSEGSSPSLTQDALDHLLKML